MAPTRLVAGLEANDGSPLFAARRRAYEMDTFIGGTVGKLRARSHRRFVPSPIHFIPESLTYSVPLFLK
jgi:hypothetical protein